MARQRLSKKKVERLKAQTSLNIEHVLVRGGTDHRKDLCLSDGKVVYLYKDGTMEESDIKWRKP